MQADGSTSSIDLPRRQQRLINSTSKRAFGGPSTAATNLLLCAGTVDDPVRGALSEPQELPHEPQEQKRSRGSHRRGGLPATQVETNYLISCAE